MADNGTAASAPTIAWDDVAGVAFQRVKVTFGADGSATDVSSSNPLPVTGTFFQTTQPVSGPLTVDELEGSTAILGIASEGTLAQILDTQIDVLAKLTAIYTNDTATVTEMPPSALSTTKRCSRALAQSSAATTTSIVSAVSGQTTRLYGATISIAGATLLEIMDGTTTKKLIRIAGACVLFLDVREEPWVTTTANTALQYKTSTAVQVDFDAEYVTSA